MSELVGSAVIVEHPFFYERHVVALVTGQTAKTVVLRYWDARTGDWKENESRRKLSFVSVLPSTDAVLVKAVHEELQALSDNLRRQQRDIAAKYHQSVANLGSPLPPPPETHPEA